MKRKYFLTISLHLTLMLLLLLVTACDDKKTEKKLTADRDVAETTAGAISYSTGGAIDQIADLCELLDLRDTTKVEQVILKDYPSRSVTVNKTYNEEQGFWTINVEKIRGDSLSIPYAHIYRKYTLKFLNEAGEAQRHYITEADTARTVKFAIKSGSGEFETRRISQQLDTLFSDWTITDANEPIVTINGTYYRAAVDKITGFNKERTSDHWLDLEFHDIHAPRGMQSNFYAAISGLISGHFHADITFQSAAAYTETSIDRNIEILLGGGNGQITWHTTAHYDADLYTGEVLD